MSEKRYYWLKLMDDFFTSKRIKRLRSLAGGDTYTIIYLKMQLKALKTGGFLYYDGIMESFAEELALDIDEKADDVSMTIAFLRNVGLLEVSESEEYHLTYMDNLVGSETASAKRVRDFRNRKCEEKPLQCNNDVTEVKQVGNGEKEKEKDIEINKFFEDLWELYPKKKGKDKVSKKSKKEIYKIGFEEMKKAIERYKAEREFKDDQYTMYGSTFFNSGYKDYLVDNSVSEKKGWLYE
jgi:predicted phage replisome organizer